MQCCIVNTHLELQEVEPHEALADGGSHQSADGGVGQDGHEKLRVDAEEDGGEGLLLRRCCVRCDPESVVRRRYTPSVCPCA